MLPALQLLVVLHVLAAMVWFGGTIFNSRRIRDAVTGPREFAVRETTAIARQTRVTTVAAVAVFLSGVGLALVTPGGFGALPPRFHLAVTLTLVWMLVDILGTGRLVRRLADATASDGPLDAAVALGRRLAMLTGIQHTLFTVVLVLMLWKL